MTATEAAKQLSGYLDKIEKDVANIQRIASSNQRPGMTTSEWYAIYSISSVLESQLMQAQLRLKKLK